MAETPRVYEVVKDIIEKEDYSTASFRRDYRPDKDEQGRIITLNNVTAYGQHHDAKSYRELKRTTTTDTVVVPIANDDMSHTKTDETNDETNITNTEELLDALAHNKITLDGGVHNNLDNVSNTLPNAPGRVMRVSRRAEVYNWSEIRKHFVIGKRTQLEDGSWITEDYTLKELAQKFGVKYDYLRYKSSSESWSKLRKAYLARVNQVNIGQELGLYTQENYQAEIAAMNACNKLGVVLDRYIEHKFGDILETSENTESDGTDVSDELASQMNVVNRTTGTPVFITELKEAIKVASDIYTLQRKIYDNAPKTEVEVIEKITNKPKFKNEKERQAKIQQLQAKLSGVLKPNEVVETVSNDTVVDMDEIEPVM